MNSSLSEESAKVFIGTKLGGKKIFVLKNNGGVEVLTHDYIEPSAIDFLAQNLPTLTPEEQVAVSKFGIEPIAASPQ